MTAIVLEGFCPIHSVVPNLNLGEVMISADKRNSKDSTEKLTDAQRIRRIVLPSDHWTNYKVMMHDGTANQGLHDILREALRGIANDRLRDTLAEEPLTAKVPLADYTIASLLAWSVETAASRGSITFTREQVEEWYKASKTQQNLVAKWLAAGKTADQMRTLSDFAAKRFAGLAAKNHGLKDAADADKLLALVDPADAETGIGADIVGRIANIVKALTAKAAEANVSMDDL